MVDSPAPDRPGRAGSRPGRRLRVGMITFRAYPEVGGVESHVEEVARRVASAGVDLELLTSDRTGALPRLEQHDGYRIRRFRAYPADRDWYLSPGLFWAALRTRYDVVHVQGVHTLVPPLAMLAALVRRTPYLLTFHTGGNSSAFRERARSTQFRILGPLLRRAAVLVGVSLYEARRFEELLRLPAGSIRVVRNGGSLPAVPDGVTADPDLVLSVGRLERYKGHHRVIEALPELIRRRPGARVTVLGVGPYEAELRALAERLGVADRVEITSVPPPDRAQMARRLAGCGVSALLSDYEAHPVAVMEALAAGRPAVVSTTSGLTELAEMGWALGVPLDAPAADVAAALDRQLSDPVRPDPAVLPTWEGCVAALLDLYTDATGGVHGPTRPTDTSDAGGSLRGAPPG